MIEMLEWIEPDDVAGLNQLARQIKSDFEDRSLESWESIVNQAGIGVVICYDDETNRIVGMGTVVVQTLPTRVKAYIEDVVVDEPFRRRGIGTIIVAELLDLAREEGAPVAYLTSSRPEAQAMWRALGWEVGATTNFFKKL